MESDTLTFEPLDQFQFQTVYEDWPSWVLVAWLDASALILQVSIGCLVLMAFPLWRLLPRVGLSKWWALAAVFPPFALILFWIAGFKRPSTTE